jgi:hypothetical protein
VLQVYSRAYSRTIQTCVDSRIMQTCVDSRVYSRTIL